MKIILRAVIFYSFSLFLLSQLFPAGLRVSGGLQTIFYGGLILAGMSLILKPILHIISLPINILTLGLFSFIINAGLLYLMTRFVPHISVHSIIVPGLIISRFATPKLALNLPEAFIFLSFMLSFMVTILGWIV